MERIKYLSTAKIIEASVATAINAVMAILGVGIFFVSMFADTSFGFGEFFFYNFILITIFLSSFAYVVLNSIESSVVKKVISGARSLSTQRNKLKIFAIIQIVFDAIYILVFFIVTTIAVVHWISNGYWELLFTEYAFGCAQELLSLIHI